LSLFGIKSFVEQFKAFARMMIFSKAMFLSLFSAEPTYWM
jgi:hypothetical protein